MPDEQIAASLRALGAQLRMTRKGRVHTVDFRETGGPITDADVSCLSRLERLHEVCLAGTAVTDAAVERLAGLEKLETLDLENTAVTDAALAHLGRMPQLKLLVLRGTQVSREAVAEFRKQMIGTRIVV